MKKGEGPIDKWRLYNNEKVIPNFKIYYTETNWLPRVISITIIQLLRVLILSRVCFVSLSILASVYHAHAIFQIWWEVKTRLVAFQRHKVALDIWDVDEVLQWCSAAASLALVPLRLRIVVNSINNILHYLYIITSRGLFLFRCSQCMLKQGGAQSDDEISLFTSRFSACKNAFDTWSDSCDRCVELECFFPSAMFCSK